MGSIKLKIWLIIMCLYLIQPLASAASGNPDENLLIISGNKIYLSNCSGCHGENVDGYAFPGAFNFTYREKMNKSNSSVFYNAITNGISGTAMPSFSRLSENERWDVIAYVNTFNYRNRKVMK
jgi:high-affinity iron transporter